MDEKVLLQYAKKKEQILCEIDPICNAFGLKNVDYKIDTEKLSEKLCIDGTEIGCTGNSVSAVVDELIAYIFVSRYCKNRDLGPFHKQTINYIKRYWIEE